MTVEQNVKSMRDDLSAYQKESDDRFRDHDVAMKRERAHREAELNAIHEKIKEAATGGLKLEWAIAWLLISGTICSTFSKELEVGVAAIGAL